MLCVSFRMKFGDCTRICGSKRTVWLAVRHPVPGAYDVSVIGPGAPLDAKKVDRGSRGIMQFIRELRTTWRGSALHTLLTPRPSFHAKNGIGFWAQSRSGRRAITPVRNPTSLVPIPTELSRFSVFIQLLKLLKILSLLLCYTSVLKCSEFIELWTRGTERECWCNMRFSWKVNVLLAHIFIIVCYCVTLFVA
jgi:hypothetical protein